MPPIPNLSDVQISIVQLADLIANEPLTGGYSSLSGAPSVSGAPYARGIGFQDLFNETGSGQFTLQNDDPMLAAITTPNTLVNFYVLDNLAFTMLCESWEAVLVDVGEEKNQATTWKGRGHKALFERGLMYPAIGITEAGDAHPIEEDRGFNWAAAIYDWVGHGAIGASVICSVLDAQTGSWASGGTIWDEDFLVPGADVLGPSTGSTTDAPIGSCYYEQVVNIATAGLYTLQVLMDNLGEVYVDGSLVLSPGQGSENPGAAWLKMSQTQLDLGVGLHTINIRCWNGGGPTGAAFGLVTLNDDGTLNAVFGASSAGSGALIFEYPTEPPGMSPGEAILVFLDEIQHGTTLGAFTVHGVRGAIPYITTSFDAVNDSNGDPWPVVGDIATKIGTTFMTFLRELSATYIDFHMAPGTLVLDAYIKEGYGSVQAIDFHPPTDPMDETTGNISQLTEKGES